MAFTSAAEPLLAGLEPIDLIEFKSDAPEAETRAVSPALALMPEDGSSDQPETTIVNRIAAPVAEDDQWIVIDDGWMDDGWIEDDGEDWQDDWVEEDYSGSWSTMIGDVNGDGIGDFLVETYSLEDGVYASGSYVAFGGTEGASPSGDVSEIAGGNGFVLVDGSGSDFWASPAGDVNGDGLVDILVSSYDAEGNCTFHLVSGAVGDQGGSVDINGSLLLSASGLGADDDLWISVVGDMNGDGIADLQFDVSKVDADGNYSYESYVVFGNAGGFEGAIDLAGLTGDEGYLVVWDDEFALSDPPILIEDPGFADDGYKMLPVCELTARDIDLII